MTNPFSIGQCGDSWGWSRSLYFRRRLLAVLVYSNGTERGSRRHLTLLVNINSPRWAPRVTLPLGAA